MKVKIKYNYKKQIKFIILIFFFYFENYDLTFRKLNYISSSNYQKSSIGVL